MAVIAAADDATARCGVETMPLAAGESLSPADCRPLQVTGGEGVSELALPDGSRLLLANGAVVNLSPDEADTIAIQLREGRLLLVSDGRAMVANVDGAWASLDRAGVLGIFLDPSSRLFEAACLAGQCSLSGEDDEQPVALRAGQGGVVGNSGRAGPPEYANYGGYLALAPDRVPTPTATPTRTPTATPTRTPTPRPYPTAIPTATAAPPENSPTVPPPPPPPNDPGPTRTTPPDTLTPVPPTETPVPKTPYPATATAEI